MNKLCLALVVLCGACSVTVAVAQTSTTSTQTPTNSYGPAFDEVVVDTNLNVRKKTSPQIRTRRSAVQPSLDILSAEPIVLKLRKNIREKRQFGFRPQRPFYGSSQSAANANSQSQNFGQNGFGASSAGAQAQGFQSQSPFGNFGASAANTNTQSFQAGPNGINGAAGIAGSQTYNLPNGHAINIAYSNGYTLANGRPSSSNGQSVTYT